MTKVFTRLKLYIFTYEWEVVEIMGAAAKISMGLWLLLPFQSFRNGSGITSVGAETIWAYALLTLGLMHMFAIRRGTRRQRQIMTFLAFLFWLFAILITVQATPTSPLIPFYGIIAFFMGLNFIRIGMTLDLREKRREDIGRPGGLPDRRQPNE